nr:hypothetical protein [Desulfobulbaceae bacterium]
MSTATSTPKKSGNTHSASTVTTSVRAGVPAKSIDAPTRKYIHDTNVESPYIAEITGLASLQDATYSVDLEKTVQDMAGIINNMEAQLDRVLSMNAIFEEDLNTSKQIITELKEEKVKLIDEVARLEAEMPSKREMQMEMDQLIEERSTSQNHIHGLNTEIDAMNKSIEAYRKEIVQLEMEKNDAVSEVTFLESRQNASRQKANSQDQKINQLKAEKVTYQKKIIRLQDECQRAMEEKYSLLRELQEAQDILSEVSRH